MNRRFPRDAIQAAARRQPTAEGEFRYPTDRASVYTHPSESGRCLNFLPATTCPDPLVDGANFLSQSPG